MDRGAWQAIVRGVTKNQTQLSNEHTHTQRFINRTSSTRQLVGKADGG